MPEAGMRNEDRVAGIALIAAAATSMLAMAHHPTSLRAGAMIGIVHGVMILVVGAMLYGFAHFARRRGLERPAVLAGLIAYGIGAAANIGAAVINGFVAPALPAHGAPGARGSVRLRLGGDQALAGLGVIAIGAAYTALVARPAADEQAGRRARPARRRRAGRAADRRLDRHAPSSGDRRSMPGRPCGRPWWAG